MTYRCPMPHCQEDVLYRHSVCDYCWEAHHGELEALPGLYELVWQLLSPARRPPEQIRVQGIDPAAPVDLSVHDDLQWSYVRLAAWTAWASSRKGEEFRPVLFASPHSFATMIKTLMDVDSCFARGNYGASYAQDLHNAYRRLLVRVVSTEARHLDATCPECGHESLVSRHADEYVVCVHCAHMWAYSQIPMLLGEKAW